MMYQLTLDAHPSPDEARLVADQLEAYNKQHTGIDQGYQPLAIFLRDEDHGEIFGGLLGETYWGWLHISILWIHEALRGQGYGQQMLRMAEVEAIQRGCHHAHLDTMSFQALPFYQKYGYAIFGQMDDIPIGHSRYFMQKTLSRADAD